MTKIVLLGANGQVGGELRRTLARFGSVLAADRGQVDLARLSMLRQFLRREAPQLIVNAAAYTAVDRAETDPDSALTINASAVEVIAEEAQRARALLVHYSTDYVFDGTRLGAYTEEDVPNPLSVYGRTKLAGERAIQESGCRHLIFRTSWLYSARGGNFARTILNAAKERETLRVVDDQLGSPTSAELLAQVTAVCIERVAHSPADYPCGLYHAAASGYTSWHEYARFIVATAAEAQMPLRLSPDNIEPVSTQQFAAAARRPENSRLDTRKLRSTFAIALPHWKVHVRRLIASLSTKDGR